MNEKVQQNTGLTLPLIRKNSSGNFTLSQIPDTRTVLNLALSETMRNIKARFADFYFYDENGKLFSFKKSKEDEEIKQICSFCSTDHADINVNPEGKSIVILEDSRYSELPENLIVTTPTICVNLTVQDGDFGILILREPEYYKQFYEEDFHMIKTFADSFSILLKNSWSHVESSEIFLDFHPSFLLLIENTHLIQKIKQSTRTLSTVLEVSNVINSSRELSEMIQAVLHGARKVMRAESASLCLIDEKTGDLVFDIISGGSKDIKGMRIPQGQGIAGLCALEKKSIIVNDAQNDPRLYKKVDEVSNQITRNLIAAPLIVSDIAIGVIEVLNTIDRSIFSENDLHIFESFSDSVAIAIQRRRMIDDLERTKAIEKEVEITSKIQQNILPSRVPEHKHVELSAKSVMAKTTGGDFYDYFVHGKDKDVSMLVADVSGKSLPAALFMAITSSIIRTFIRSENNPTRILELANRLIFEESESGMFVTVFLARYEPTARRLSFASAGHNEMILMHGDGRYELLSGHGAPLGVLPEQKGKYTGGEREIADGDILILYTDGVVEAVNEKKEEFGLEKFINLLTKHRHKSPQELISIIYDSVTTFAGTELQFDDFTMLVSNFTDSTRIKNCYHIAMPAIPESIPCLREFVRQICNQHGIKNYVLDDLLLVSDEAATNIVMHAYGEIRIENPSFSCSLEVETGKQIIIIFQDSGKAFDLDEVRMPNLKANLAGERDGGFGVYLMRKVMDRLESKRKDGINYLFAEKKLE